MSLMDKIRGEFIDIIEWNDDSTDTLVWRFPRYQDEIKNGAQLTVRPSQVAVFVSEGRIADVFEPGMHTLTTSNLPVLSTLKGWKFGFDSPFKAEVYFVSSKLFTNLKWGTLNPVVLRDAELGSVRVKAYGTYVVRVNNPRKMVELLAGTGARFSLENIHEQLRGIVLSAFADMLGSSSIPVLDLAAHYDELSVSLANLVAKAFSEMGLETTRVFIESIALPDDVAKAIDRKASMGVVGNLDQYAKFQAANAMEAAASNPGGAGSAMGMGVGFAMANQVGQAASQAQSAPPPLPKGDWWIALQGKRNGPHTLETLLEMIQNGTINALTPVWKPGRSDWTKADTFAELRQALQSVPPPLP